MTEPSKHRWFRFSLRTLFVVVTIAGAWLGYHWKWAKERRDFLEELDQFHATHFKMHYVPLRDGSAPGMLWLLGERGVPDLNVTIIIGNREKRLPNASYPQWLRAQRLFPEARIFGGPITEAQVLASVEEAERMREVLKSLPVTLRGPKKPSAYFPVEEAQIDTPRGKSNRQAP